MVHSHGPLCLPAPTAGNDDADPEPDNAPSANVKSRADWKRSAGFFSRQWRTMRSRPGEIFTVVGSISAGSDLRIAFMVSTDESPPNAGLPESISYSTAPKLKMSAR